MAGFLNYIQDRLGLLSIPDRDLKINGRDPGLSGWDLKKYYSTLPNGKPMPKNYKRPRPYGDKS